MLVWLLNVLFSSGIAIFCMLLTYYMWIKAVKTGSIYWAAKCALAYFYMVTIYKYSLCLFLFLVQEIEPILSI